MRPFLPLMAVLFIAPVPQDQGWRTVPVPGPRKADEAAPDAWYRAWVKADDGFFSKHERNLFEESVGINLRGLAGSHEVWVNGKKIGAGAAGDVLHRHKVPVGTLRKGEWNEVAIRVHTPADAAPGGFLAEAPFIMNYFMECVFEGEWEYRVGADYQPGGARADQPGRAVFQKFRESNR